MATTNPITQSRFVELVKAGLTKVYEDRISELHQKEMMREKFFNITKSTKAYEDYYSVGELGDIPAFNGVLVYGDVSPGYSTRIEPKEFALGVEIERKFWDNNLYNVLKDWGKKLANSSHRTKEKYAIGAYAKLDSVAFDFMTSEEGVAICSTAHTTKATGVSTTTGFGNLGSTAFSPTAVEATRILMRGFRNSIGERQAIHPNGLIGPTTLEQKFAELIGTDKGLYSAEGTINVQAKKWKYEVSDYLNDTSTKNWLMVDWELVKEFALWVDHTADELTNTVDFETKKIKHSSYSYWGLGFTGWCPFYMHKVS